MRLRNVTGSREMIGESRFVVHEPEQQKGMWRSAFGNDRPVYVEIGMGKGRFLMDMARLNPEINFIGIEKYSTVLLRAVQKLEEEELPNVRLLRMDAEDFGKCVCRRGIGTGYILIFLTRGRRTGMQKDVWNPDSFWRGMTRY